MIRLLSCSLTFLFAATQPVGGVDELADLAQRIDGSDSALERVDLARLGRRRDSGGSVWWYEIEARARFKVGDHAAVIRLCSAALAHSPQAADRARMLELRATSYASFLDEERELGDLWQLTRLRPDDAVARARLHSLIAARLQARQAARVLDEAESRIERFPEDAAARIQLARVYAAQGDPASAHRSYASARELDTEALQLVDWVAYGRLSLEVLDFEGAFTAFEMAGELDPQHDFEDELDQALDVQRDMLGGGFADYDYEDEEEGEEQAPTEPISVEQLRSELERWSATLEQLSARAELEYDRYWEIQPRASALVEELQASSDVAAFENSAALVRKEFGEWSAQNEALTMEVDALFEDFNVRNGQCWSRETSGEEAELCSALHALANEYGALEYRAPENLGFVDLGTFLDEALTEHRAAMKSERLAREAVEQRDREVAQLLSERIKLPAEVVQARTKALFARGADSPELLAAFGIACVAIGENARAEIPLHLSLATDQDHELIEEALAALRALDGRAQEQLESAHELLEQVQARAALVLAERASDLSPTNAACHALEARCLVALKREIDALPPIRLASALDPHSRKFAYEHEQIAMANRRVTEALAICNQRLAINPRDVAALRDRADFLLMCGRTDEATSDRTFANIFAERQSSGPFWRDYLHSRSTLSPYIYRPDQHGWSDCHKNQLRSLMEWIPNGSLESEPSTQLIDRLYEVLCERMELEQLLAPPSGLLPPYDEEWPAVANFLAGEVLAERQQWDDARPYFTAAMDDPLLPTTLAFLASQRIDESLPRYGGWHGSARYLPIRVPLDVKTLKQALAVASPGQTIELGSGIWYLQQHLERSVRLVGAGAGRTELRVGINVSYPDPAQNLALRPAAENGAPGWIEFADLTFVESGTYDSSAWERGLESRFAVERGSVSLERCSFEQLSGFVLGAGARLAVFDCDLSEAQRAPIIARGGNLTLDKVLLEQVVELGSGASLFADMLTLHAGGAVHLAGPETRGRITSLTAYGLTGAGLVATDGAHCDVQLAVLDNDQKVTFAHAESDGSLAIADLHNFGQGLAGKGNIAASETSSKPFAGDAHAKVPARVENSDELLEALASGAQHVELAPALYLLADRDVTGQLVLHAREPGVRIEVPSDRGECIFSVAEGGELELDGIELGVQDYREPAPGDPLYGSGGAYGNDVRYDEYRLIRAMGTVLLRNCTQTNLVAGNERASILLAGVTGGRLASFGLNDGGRLRADSGANVWLADGGVSHLQVQSGALVQLSGRGVLDRLEVVGAASRVELDDLRPARINYVSFREGAFDPRSELRKSKDGYDPLVVRDEELARAHAKWMEPLGPDSSEAEWERGLAEYAMAYESALYSTIQDRSARAELAAQQILPHLRGRKKRIRAALESVQVYDSLPPLWYALRDGLSDSDLNWYYAEGRARRALGSDSTAEALADYAEWEEAVLSGRATQEQADSGRAQGLSLSQYINEQHRLERAESEAQAALASGDRSRIRKALTDVSLDRWLEYVRHDDDATLAEVRDAEQSAFGTEHEYWLSNKRSRMENEVEEQQYQTSYSTAYSGASSTPGYSPYAQQAQSEFRNWQIQCNTWNRDMTNTLNAIKNSSYTSYRNTYSY